MEKVTKLPGKRFWVVQQHDQMTVVESAERPSKVVEKGQRVKKLHGPYTSKSDAQERADHLESRTLRAWARKE